MSFRAIYSQLLLKLWKISFELSSVFKISEVIEIVNTAYCNFLSDRFVTVPINVHVYGGSVLLHAESKLKELFTNGRICFDIVTAENTEIEETS